MQTKSLRKICGRLKEDGLLSVQSRAEKRTDGTQSFYGTTQGPNRERLSHKDWYYINFHKAIDSVKYKMYKLNKHVENLGAPTAEKKELICPRCKSQYTYLEAMDHMDYTTGVQSCAKCGHELDTVDEDERTNENETMKRLNSQLEKVLSLLQRIDQTTVPENDFQTALSKAKPIIRKEDNPGQQRTEIVDLPNRNLQSTKGLDIKPEKIAVQVQDDEDVKRENEASDAAARREKEARQNALPDWIAKSTVTGDITAVGAKEERLKQEREATAAVTKDGDGDEKKPLKDEDEESKMKEYFAELEKANAIAAAAAKSEDEDEEDDEDEDDFEDVDVTGTGADGTPMRNGNGINGSRGSASGMNTPNINSSNASDDERDTKRVKSETTANSSAAQANGGTSKAAEDTPAVSDDDEDGLDFEDV